LCELTLTGDNWVNDHIIEFYLQMVVRRSTLEENTGMPRVHAMNTYFYTRLINSGYSSVQNWTKNIDIFSYSLILIPIHLDLHWNCQNKCYMVYNIYIYVTYTIIYKGFRAFLPALLSSQIFVALFDQNVDVLDQLIFLQRQLFHLVVQVS
jgi:Ulp1 protease family, C-terminal catalytic domain